MMARLAMLICLIGTSSTIDKLLNISMLPGNLVSTIYACNHGDEMRTEKINHITKNDGKKKDPTNESTIKG